MDPFTISLGVAALGSVASYSARQEAAALQRARADEQARRLRLEHERTLSAGRAAAAASGIEFDSSSLQTYLGAMRDEFSRQEAWMRATGEREADATSSAAKWGLFSDLGGALFSYGMANKLGAIAAGASIAKSTMTLANPGVNEAGFPAWEDWSRTPRRRSSVTITEPGASPQADFPAWEDWRR